MIKSFPFCSMSHQQAIQILNALKESFDQEDLTTLKTFVKNEMGGDTNFNFPSGFKTSGMNMGQIIQIAFELRNITQALLNDEESSEEDEDEAAVARHAEMSNWFKFCKEKVEKIEKVWNRKLEDDNKSTGSDEHSSEEERERERKEQAEKDDYEKSLQAMFENFGKKNLSKSFSGPSAA